MKSKKLFSWILAIGMVIMMLPLNAFAANSANTTDFEYSTPDDITIYKNETKEVEISSYVYGNHKSYDLDSISVSSDNANIEVTQPSKGRMKVKGLKEGISAVIIKYSWLYNGKKQTGTSSFKVTVKDFQYCWELEGQGYYNDNDSNDLYIGESKEWNVNLRKIYYKDNGKKCQQRIKDFDIITKTYRKVENEDEDADEWYALYENSMAGIEVLDSSGRKVLESDSYYSSPTYKKAASCVFDLEKGKTYYFSYDTCYSYKGYTGSRWDLFRTSPEKIRLSYIENDDQDSSHVHNYIATITKQVTCTTDGIRTFKCSCGDSYQETIKATGHLHKEIRNKKEATETEAGYTGDIYCKDCNTMLEKGSIIPATGQKQPSDIDSTNTPAKPSQPSKDKNNTSSTQTPKQENSLKQGAKVTDNKSKAVYKVNGNKTVEYNKVDKKAKTAIIPTTVKVNGVNYQVTAIAAKAFANNKSLKKVVIPASVRKIGKQAFSGCKNLKTIIIKTPHLTKKSVGAKAFKGIYAKATIKVPKKQKKAYQKLLKSKGVGKKAKIK